MNLFKQIFIKLLLLVALLVIANYTYKYTFWSSDRAEYADVLDSLNNIVNSTDVLYLSSSSNYFHPKSDTVGYTISGLIDKQFPNLRVNAINKGYLHAGVFNSILQNIPESSPIKTVILSVNMRSFGAYWLFSETETVYSQMELLLNTNYPLIIKRFLLSLDYYDNLSKKERETQYLEAWKHDTILIPKYNINTTVYNWDKECALNGGFKTIKDEMDNDKLGFKCNIIKAFAYTLDTINNIRFKQFDNIIQLAEKRNWNLIFNILPEDIDKAEIMVGKEIPYILQNNKELFINKYKNSKVAIIDNLDLLDGSNFYESYPTEHYTTNGKQMIANELSKVLSSIVLNKDSVFLYSVNKKNKIKQSKLVDKEITLSSQMPYSEVWDVNSLDVFKSKADSITIEFKSSTEITDSLMFVLQYLNNENIYFWESYKLKSFKNIEERKVKKIKLPKIIDSNDIIRMYFWNAGKQNFIINNYTFLINNE